LFGRLNNNIRGAILHFQNFPDVCHFQNGCQYTAYKWGVKIQHCPISSKFDMWVDSVSVKFCPVVPEICRGQVHASRKERIRIIIIKIKIIIRNGAKTISPPNFVWET
jgi:hypothetical protein